MEATPNLPPRLNAPWSQYERYGLQSDPDDDNDGVGDSNMRVMDGKELGSWIGADEMAQEEFLDQEAIPGDTKAETEAVEEDASPAEEAPADEASAPADTDAADAADAASDVAPEMQAEEAPADGTTEDTAAPADSEAPSVPAEQAMPEDVEQAQEAASQEQAPSIMPPSAFSKPGAPGAPGAPGPKAKAAGPGHGKAKGPKAHGPVPKPIVKAAKKALAKPRHARVAEAKAKLKKVKFKPVSEKHPGASVLAEDYVKRGKARRSKNGNVVQMYVRKKDKFRYNEISTKAGPKLFVRIGATFDVGGEEVHVGPASARRAAGMLEVQYPVTLAHSGRRFLNNKLIDERKLTAHLVLDHARKHGVAPHPGHGHGLASGIVEVGAFCEDWRGVKKAAKGIALAATTSGAALHKAAHGTHGAAHGSSHGARAVSGDAASDMLALGKKYGSPEVKQAAEYGQRGQELVKQAQGIDTSAKGISTLAKKTATEGLSKGAQAYGVPGPVADILAPVLADAMGPVFDMLGDMGRSAVCKFGTCIEQRHRNLVADAEKALVLVEFASDGSVDVQKTAWIAKQFLDDKAPHFKGISLEEVKGDTVAKIQQELKAGKYKTPGGAPLSWEDFAAHIARVAKSYYKPGGNEQERMAERTRRFNLFKSKSMGGASRPAHVPPGQAPGQPSPVQSGPAAAMAATAKTLQDAGQGALLGKPTAPAHAWHKGTWVQDFQAAWGDKSVLVTVGDKVLWVRGAVYAKWMAMGGGAGAMGLPTSNEEPLDANGNVIQPAQAGHNPAFARQAFEGGTIVWDFGQNKAIAKKHDGTEIAGESEIFGAAGKGFVVKPTARPGAPAKAFVVKPTAMAARVPAAAFRTNAPRRAAPAARQIKISKPYKKGGKVYIGAFDVVDGRLDLSAPRRLQAAQSEGDEAPRRGIVVNADIYPANYPADARRGGWKLIGQALRFKEGVGGSRKRFLVNEQTKQLGVEDLLIDGYGDGISMAWTDAGPLKAEHVAALKQRGMLVAGDASGEASADSSAMYAAPSVRAALGKLVFWVPNDQETPLFLTHDGRLFIAKTQEGGKNTFLGKATRQLLESYGVTPQQRQQAARFMISESGFHTVSGAVSSVDHDEDSPAMAKAFAASTSNWTTDRPASPHESLKSFVVAGKRYMLFADAHGNQWVQPFGGGGGGSAQYMPAAVFAKKVQAISGSNPAQDAAASVKAALSKLVFWLPNRQKAALFLTRDGRLHIAKKGGRNVDVGKATRQLLEGYGVTPEHRVKAARFLVSGAPALSTPRRLQLSDGEGSRGSALVIVGASAPMEPPHQSALDKSYAAVARRSFVTVYKRLDDGRRFALVHRPGRARQWRALSVRRARHGGANSEDGVSAGRGWQAGLASQRYANTDVQTPYGTLAAGPWMFVIPDAPDIADDPVESYYRLGMVEICAGQKNVGAFGAGGAGGSGGTATEGAWVEVDWDALKLPAKLVGKKAMPGALHRFFIDAHGKLFRKIYKTTDAGVDENSYETWCYAGADEAAQIQQLRNLKDGHSMSKAAKPPQAAFKMVKVSGQPAYLAVTPGTRGSR